MVANKGRRRPPTPTDTASETADPPAPGADGGINLGPALRHAWIGYQRRLDEAMAASGFEDRRFPDGRVLRMCTDPTGTTISSIGRQLGITRQGAAKVVGHLRHRGYVSVADSATSGREKSVTLTARGDAYLTAQRKAARTIDRQLRAEVGEVAFAGLSRLLDALDPGEELRLSTYLRRAASDPGHPANRPSRKDERRQS